MLNNDFTAILSFVAAFFLVRFRLHEASKQEHKQEHMLAEQQAAHKAVYDPDPSDEKPANGDAAEHKPALHAPPPPIFSSNPHLEQVGPLRRGQPPTHLLEACHTVCMLISVLGFAMAMIGVLCYVWEMLPRSSGVLSTVCIGFCVTAAGVAICMPQSLSVFAPVHVTEPS